MKNKNYCQVGTPVQFFQAYSKKAKWIVCAGVISKVEGAIVSIIYKRYDKPQFNFDEPDVRHADFKKSGEHYWDYIPQEHPKVK